MKITDFAPNTAIITTSFVMHDQADIVYVSIDKGGDIQVFSDEGAVMEKAMVISLEEVLEIDPTLRTLPAIEKGDKFYRPDTHSPWQKIG